MEAAFNLLFLIVSNILPTDTFMQINSVIDSMTCKKSVLYVKYYTLCSSTQDVHWT